MKTIVTVIDDFVASQNLDSGRVYIYREDRCLFRQNELPMSVSDLKEYLRKTIDLVGESWLK